MLIPVLLDMCALGCSPACIFYRLHGVGAACWTGFEATASDGLSLF